MSSLGLACCGPYTAKGFTWGNSGSCQRRGRCHKKAINVSSSCFLPASRPCFLPIYAIQSTRSCPRIAINASSYQRSMPVCLFGGKGNSGKDDEYNHFIDGEEMTRLAGDYIKCLFSGKQSNRLKQTMYMWKRFYLRLTRKGGGR